MKLENCRQELSRRGFEAIVVASAAEARREVMAQIEAFAPGSVAFGGSATIEGLGIVEELRRSKRWPLIDTVDYTMPRQQRLELRREALLCDLFITGVNAVTEDGVLFWLDAYGNRVAAVAFGPRKVVLVVGRNKIVASREAAEERIRRVAAPQNAKRLGCNTPCVKTGVCMDCSSEERICCTHVRMERCTPKGRISVILVDENLGL